MASKAPDFLNLWKFGRKPWTNISFANSFLSLLPSGATHTPGISIADHVTFALERRLHWCGHRRPTRRAFWIRPPQWLLRRVSIPHCMDCSLATLIKSSTRCQLPSNHGCNWRYLSCQCHVLWCQWYDVQGEYMVDKD